MTRFHSIVYVQEAVEKTPEGQSPKAIRDLYEEIGYVEAKFNRLILYRSGLLHSARMGDSEV